MIDWSLDGYYNRVIVVSCDGLWWTQDGLCCCLMMDIYNDYDYESNNHWCPCKHITIKCTTFPMINWQKFAKNAIDYPKIRSRFHCCEWCSLRSNSHCATFKMCIFHYLRRTLSRLTPLSVQRRIRCSCIWKGNQMR